MIKKKFFFFTVQLLRSKNGFSGGKAPEKINLRNNCHPNTYVTKFFSILAHYGIIIYFILKENENNQLLVMKNARRMKKRTPSARAEEVSYLQGKQVSLRYGSFYSIGVMNIAHRSILSDNVLTAYPETKVSTTGSIVYVHKNAIRLQLKCIPHQRTIKSHYHLMRYKLVFH